MHITLAPNRERGKPRDELLLRWREAPRHVRHAVVSLLEDYGRIDRACLVEEGEAFEVAAALLEELANGRP